LSQIKGNSINKCDLFSSQFPLGAAIVITQPAHQTTTYDTIYMHNISIPTFW